MALVLNGSANTIGGLAVGGLPDGIVDTDMIAANAVTASKRGAGAILQVIHNTVAGSSLNNTTSTTHSDTGLSIDITPSSTSSKIFITLAVRVYIHSGGGDTGSFFSIKRKIDSGSYSLLANLTSADDQMLTYVSGGSADAVEALNPVQLIHYDAPSTTGVCTYKLTFAAGAGGTVSLSGSDRNAIATAWEIAG